MEVLNLRLNFIHTCDWRSASFQHPRSIREMQYSGTVMSFILSTSIIMGPKIRQVRIISPTPFSMPMFEADAWKKLVMYIPAVPLTPQNQAYIDRQRTNFLRGERPPDFPKGNLKSELNFVGVATVNDVGRAGRRAMGLQEA
jgi:Protein of unknown function (DUF1479)